MNLIKVPETNYTNFSDKMKFNLTWNINIVIFITNLVLLPFFYFIAFDEFIGLLFSSTLALIYQIVLYSTRKYEIVAVIWVVLGVCSTCVSLFFVPSLVHLTDIIFMFMVIIYAFFTLGRYAGILTSFSILTTLTFYFIYYLNQDQLSFTELSSLEIAQTTVLSAYGLTIISYIIFKYLDLTKHTTEQLISTNQQLEKTNELVEKQNEEKTVMLKEIHHRVKNNLQVITSLLRLQSSDEINTNSDDLFNEAIRRVAAMSMIHEKMYQSQDLRQLDFNDYLISLTDDLINSYAITKDIKIDVNAPALDLADKYVVPVALLCNELISNSLKHAFEERTRGNISVHVAIDPAGTYNLHYSDNGRWKEPSSPHSFGMELIDSLSQQLDGSFRRNSDENGTSYRFRFNNLSD